jgi:hypothetical protein
MKIQSLKALDFLFVWIDAVSNTESKLPNSDLAKQHSLTLTLQADIAGL